MEKKRCLILLIVFVFVFLLVGCSKSKGEDLQAAIRVNGTIYYSTNNAISVEVDESAIQYTTSYAKNGVPNKDGEANFNRELGTPYTILDDAMVVVLIEDEWIEFKEK